MPREDEDGPERTCIVTRRKGPPESMIRFVVGPDATVVADLRRKLPGRGVWVTANEETVAKAVRANAFARGFRAKVRAEPTLAADIDDLLVRDALQSLAMANKAGVVTTGFAKVEAAIGSSKLAVVLHAGDAGEDGIRKLAAMARRRGPASSGLAILTKLFTSEQLDLALGRTNVIHASLAAGPAGEAFLTRCRGLMTYRSSAQDDLSADAKAAPA